MLTDEQLTRIARALGDPIRLRILDLVKEGYDRLGKEPPVTCCPRGVCVCDIQEAIGMAQSKVSYHLRELRNAGLLHEQRVGKWNFYALNGKTLEAFRNELARRYGPAGQEEEAVRISVE